MKLLLILILNACLWATPLLPKAQSFRLVSYTVQDGLVANPVRRIFQDSKGFIWIGTWEGLSRYDGYRFTNFSTTNGLSHNLINDFFETNGKIYVAENNGAIDAIQNEKVELIYRIPSAANRFFYTNKNDILLTTDEDGIQQFRNNKFFTLPQQMKYQGLHQIVSFNDSLYMGITEWKMLSIQSADHGLQSSAPFKGIHFYRLYKDSRNRIWACTSTGLKLVAPVAKRGQPLRFLPLPAFFNQQQIRESSITDMLEDECGGYWIGSIKGLLYLHPSGKLYLYSEKDGLPSSVVNTIYFDKEKNLWIGTALGLAKLITRNNIRFLEDSRGTRRNDILDVYPKKNSDLLLSCFSGVQYYKSTNSETNHLYRSPFSFAASFVTGRWPLQFYYSNTIVQLDEPATKIMETKRFNQFSTADFSSCTDRFGTSFISNNKGIAVVLKNGRYFIDSTLPFRITALVTNGANELWAGTWDHGLYRLHYSIANDTIVLSVTDMTSYVGQKHIRSLFRDSKGNIWVGTRYHGAFCIKHVPDKGFTVQQYERGQGLTSNFITAFAETGKGDIWIGTYLGLDKLVREKDSFRIFNFSRITNFFAHIRAIVPAEKNNWYCIANHALAKFPDENLESFPPPQPHILSATFGSAEEAIKLFRTDTIVTLKHFQNRIKFAFSAPSYINEKQVLYSYRLVGSVDTTWSTPQNIHEVSFASLSPSHYRFEVRTIGWDRKPGQPAMLSFVIRPPFWQTGWFYGLCAVIIAAFFYILHRYRINAVLKWQKVRDRIATDLHDDLGSTLTNISILSELSHKNLHQPEQAKHFLRRISEEVYTTSQAMDDIIWSVNSRNDSLEETLARMRRYAAELFENSAVNCHLILGEANEGIRLGMEQRRDVYLIFKESLNNIHRHAGASNVWINVWQKAGFLHLHIKDDGKGFNPDVPVSRNGLKNLKSRVQKWKGSIRIASAADRGTNIEISIPTCS